MGDSPGIPRRRKKIITEPWYSIWNDRILENFSKANLFNICCIVAGLLLILYLGAFSCEVSWILENHGDLPTPAYLLCAGYFIMFVASTILIHGLVTGLPWGLFSWSIVIGIISIPELALVMIMTTQHWGFQSTHGLTELITYLIRLLINCAALLCVIPTALRWRRDTQVLVQLQTLATRLQMPTTPTQSVHLGNFNSKQGSKNHRRTNQAGSYNNPAFLISEEEFINASSYCNEYCSRNEFNASMFGLDSLQIKPTQTTDTFNAKRTQSLMDLRFGIPNSYITNDYYDETDGKFLNNYFENTKIVNEKTKNFDDLTAIGSPEPIYCTIEPNKTTKLARNCVSLDNLNEIMTIRNDLGYGNNLLENYNLLPIIRYPIGFRQIFNSEKKYQQQLFKCQLPFIGNGGIGYGGYTNPYVNNSNTNSKQSLGTESDDYRKYRDVAL